MSKKKKERKRGGENKIKIKSEREKEVRINEIGVERVDVLILCISTTMYSILSIYLCICISIYLSYTSYKKPFVFDISLLFKGR